MALVVHPHFHPRRTGVTRHVEAIVPALAAAQIETRALGRVLGSGVPRIGWRELWRRGRLEDVVWHAHRNLELLAGLVLRALRPRVRVAFTRHSGNRPGWYTRMLARRADVRVALTREVQEAFGLPSTIVSHGLDLRAFAPPPDRAAAWRALEQGGERGIGVVGRIREEKGQGDFVRAVAPLLSRHPGWTPVLVGAARPKDQGFLRGLLAEAGGALRTPGEQADPAPWYRGLTVFVHPSRREAFSMALLEAMASGCCVVASRLPNMLEVVEEGRTGFLFTPGDVEGLRKILDELMASPARAAEVGAAAASDARRRFGVDREARRLAEAYRAAGCAP